MKSNRSPHTHTRKHMPLSLIALACFHKQIYSKHYSFLLSSIFVFAACWVRCRAPPKKKLMTKNIDRKKGKEHFWANECMANIFFIFSFGFTRKWCRVCVHFFSCNMNQSKMGGGKKDAEKDKIVTFHKIFFGFNNSPLDIHINTLYRWPVPISCNNFSSFLLSLLVLTSCRCSI